MKAASNFNLEQGWVAVIENGAKEKNRGAHLVGKRGIVERITNKGYRVEQQ